MAKTLEEIKGVAEEVSKSCRANILIQEEHEKMLTKEHREILKSLEDNREIVKKLQKEGAEPGCFSHLLILEMYDRAQEIGSLIVQCRDKINHEKEELATLKLFSLI